jgi:hypothetical protein
MEKISMLRKISLIHAVKCDKTTSDMIAIQSSNTLSELINQIVVNQAHDFQGIIALVDAWQNQVPIVTDYDINFLLKK